MSASFSSREPGQNPWLKPISAFRASLAREGLSASTAQFTDREVEARYTQHLVKAALPSDIIFWVASIIGFFSFAFLDVLTISENLTEVLIVRFTFGAAMIGLATMVLIPGLRRHFSWLTAGGLLVSAVGIIIMIALIPPAGAPPYIIGVLVVFIASSCLMRIPFRIASSVYLASTFGYLAVLHFGADFTKTDIVSGHFFMVSIVVVAILTNYTQEIRSRMIWQRDEQRRQDAAMIERLLIEATAADQSKINFLSMMSHELRTPLHQIIGYTEVVTNAFRAANDEGESDNVRHLNEIHGSAHELLARIQKMLRYADATAGKMKYELDDTPISELVEASVEQLQNKLEEKSLSVDTSALESANVRIDIVHTCYALNNILENAITASPENSAIHVSGAPVDGGGFDLVIRDEGAGMSAEQIDLALKPFTQGEHALARSREGMGLGLTLADLIFRDQNATIELQSQQGAGVTVIIRFRAAAAKSAGAHERAAG